MECNKPTAAELAASAREQEAHDRRIALELVDAINANPTMTYGELSELTGYRLEIIARVVVSRLAEGVTGTSVRLRDPAGRGVSSHNGKVTNDLGEYE